MAWMRSSVRSRLAPPSPHPATFSEVHQSARSAAFRGILGQWRALAVGRQPGRGGGNYGGTRQLRTGVTPVLTDNSIRSAKPREKPYKMGDSGGLFILVHPSGARWWCFKFRVAGKEKLLSFGVNPDVPLKLARERRYSTR